MKVRTLSISNSKMTKLSYKLLTVMVIVLVSAGIAEYCLRKTFYSRGEGATYILKYRDVFKKNNKADIFILGNSHAAHGIIPSYMELSGHITYNYAFNGAGPSFNYDLYRVYLKKYQNKPKLVIYAVNWFMFDSKWMFRKISQDYKFMPWVDVMQFPPRFYERLLLAHEDDTLNKLFKRDISKLKISDYANGFTPFEQLYKSTTKIIQTKTVPEEIDNFIDFINMIKQNGIQLILIETPEYSPDVKCDAIPANKNILRSIAKSNHIEFLDYNQERETDINYNRSCFSDWGHLNYLGAKLFSEMLSKDINQLLKSGKIVL